MKHSKETLKKVRVTCKSLLLEKLAAHRVLILIELQKLQYCEHVHNFWSLISGRETHMVCYKDPLHTVKYIHKSNFKNDILTEISEF